MRTNLIKTTTGYLAIVSLITCSLVSLETNAMTSRDAFTLRSVPLKSLIIDSQVKPANVDKATVFVRNTADKTTPPATTAAPKEKKTEDKKAISRCWKRLMNMAREIRHAHTKTSK